MKPFHDLTHRGQAGRLRPHAEQILAAFGVKPASLRQLTAATNIVFRVDAADGRRFVLRLTSPKSAHSLEAVRSEIAWIRAIRRETDIGVAEPFATREGEFVLPLTAPDVPGEWFGALYGWVPGRMLSERMTPDNIARHGALAARLHDHGERFEPPKGFRIRTYRDLFPYSDPAFPNPEPIMLFDHCGPELMPAEQVSVFREARDRIQVEIDQLFAERTPHVIHNDLHVWNVKLHRSQTFALDFEDLLWGHPVQDLATTLYYYRYRPDHETLFRAFRSGYESARTWPEDHEGQIEALIAGRGILLANFVAASQDAADRAFAPEYLARTEERLQSFLAACG